LRRLHNTTLYASIFRFDDEALINPGYTGMNSTPSDAVLADQLLAAYAHLREIEAKGAKLRREFRENRIASEEWAWWYDHHYEPAYTHFDDALIALQQALGDSFPRPTSLAICANWPRHPQHIQHRTSSTDEPL
jgi:hypothetical protein